VPLSVAAYVDPAGGPVLPNSPSVSLTGEGFVAGATEVRVGGISVQATVGAGGASLTFPTPAGPSGTVAPISVLVQGIESDPALWVTL
jgi:hypothetical protein